MKEKKIVKIAMYSGFANGDSFCQAKYLDLITEKLCKVSEINPSWKLRDYVVYQDRLAIQLDQISPSSVFSVDGINLDTEGYFFAKPEITETSLDGFEYSVNLFGVIDLKRWILAEVSLKVVSINLGEVSHQPKHVIIKEVSPQELVLLVDPYIILECFAQYFDNIFHRTAARLAILEECNEEFKQDLSFLRII